MFNKNKKKLNKRIELVVVIVFTAIHDLTIAMSGQTKDFDVNGLLVKDGGTNININIFNTTGQKVMSKMIGGTEGMNIDKIDISTLAPGNYLIKVDNGIDSVSRMFVIQN